MMETNKIAKLLQTYFNGESTFEEEELLKNYFHSGNVAEEFQEYTPFFSGISELTDVAGDENIEEEIMDFILENENREKTKYRRMWQTVTGIAASVIIVLGGFLFYQQQQKPFADTFKDPEDAYVYATQTLQFISEKYNKGLAGLTNFEKLQKASQPLQKATAPVVEFYKTLERIENTPGEGISEMKKENYESNDSI